ncbi:MAG: hypothetical protein AAFN07_06225 [Pseudomonadota bacterium]
MNEKLRRRESRGSDAAHPSVGDDPRRWRGQSLDHVMQDMWEVDAVDSWLADEAAADWQGV